MLRNYLLIAWRNLLRHKIFSLINISGLAIALAACLLLLQYVTYERSYDRFHANGDRIYRVSVDGYRNGQFTVADACSYNASGPALEKDFPEVIDFAHFRLRDQCTLSYGTRRFREPRVGLANDRFFTMFSFPLRTGNPATALSQPNTVVLSSSTADKYFGEEDPLGKVISFHDGSHREYLTVTGIMEDMPATSHFHLEAVVSYATARDWQSWGFGWTGNNDFVYVLLAEQADPAALAAKMPAFSQKYLKGEPGNIDQLVIQPLHDIHLHSNKTYEAEPNGSATLVYMLSVVGFLLLVIGWVNYVNLATARSVERAKEVGIRKVVGSGRGQLVQQFLLEAMLLNVLALLLALTVVQLAQPFLDQLTGQPLSSHQPGWQVWLGWVGVVAVGAGLVGLYPAWVLSGHAPVTVLKGKYSHSKGGVQIRKGLVVFQFAASVILVTGTLAVGRQVSFMQQQDLGMNIDQTLVLHAPQLDLPDSVAALRLGAFRQKVNQLPEVRGVATSECLPGQGYYELNSSSLSRMGDPDPGRQPSIFYLFGIDEEFIPVLEMELLAGRNFGSRSDQANQDKVILNEEAIRHLGFGKVGEAVHQQVMFWDGKPREIIGVIRNYNHHSLEKGFDPMVYYYSANSPIGYISLKLDMGGTAAQELPEALEKIKTAWAQVFPGNTFSYFFLDEMFNRQYRADRQFGQVFGLFSGLAIFIAGLGLFGLASFATTLRTKEIGVRKILGASVSQIMTLLSRDFLKLVLLANLLAWPLAWWGVREWLQQYAFRIDLNPWLMLAPSLVVLLIALLTVSGQTWRAARSNPVDSLRDE